MSAIRVRRIAALEAIDRFRRLHGLPEGDLRVERRPGGIIALIGTAPNGDEYGIGYSAVR